MCIHGSRCLFYVEASKPMSKDTGSYGLVVINNLFVIWRSKVSGSHSQSEIHDHSLQENVVIWNFAGSRGEQRTKAFNMRGLTKECRVRFLPDASTSDYKYCHGLHHFFSPTALEPTLGAASSCVLEANIYNGSFADLYRPVTHEYFAAQVKISVSSSKNYCCRLEDSVEAAHASGSLYPWRSLLALFFL